MRWGQREAKTMVKTLTHDRWKEVLEGLSSNKEEVKKHEQPGKLQRFSVDPKPR